MTLRAGTTYVQTIPGVDYPPTEGWAGTLYLYGPAKITAAATADGSDFKVTVPAATTANWAAGSYRWAFEVSKGSEKYIVQEGSLEVLVSFAAMATETDNRSTAKKNLDAINAVLQGKITKDVSQYQIAGRMVTRMSLDDLLKARDRFSREYKRELQAEAAAQGRPLQNKVRFKF